MSFIDVTYFAGEITIPNGNRDDVKQRLNGFISYREPELLKKLMGFGFYTDFVNGLEQNPIDQKWLNLLNGCQYVDSAGNRQEWLGLISTPFNVVSASFASGIISIVVNRGTLMDGAVPLDPVAGQNTANIPTSLQGKSFVFAERNFGPFTPSEFSIINAGTQIQFTGGKTFVAGDTYFWYAAIADISSAPGIVKKSLIANYVYFWFTRDSFSITTPVGEKGSKTENSVRINPNIKLVRAWNEMVDWIYQFYAFVWAKASTDYPQWLTWAQSNGWSNCWDYGYPGNFYYWPEEHLFRKLNVLGI